MADEGVRSKKEIAIAVIGLLGVLFTAFVSNLDKIFPDRSVVTSKFTGYTPTSDPQLEFEYFVKITGLKTQIEMTQKYFLAQQEQQLGQMLANNPKAHEKANKIIAEELELYNNKAIKEFVNIASQLFTVTEVQELNKFYSTPIMREFLRRQPLMQKHYFSALTPLTAELEKRLKTRFHNELRI